MLKKLIAVLLVSMLVFAAFPVINAAESVGADAEALTAVQKLISLGILDSAPSSYDAPLTRSEFVRLAALAGKAQAGGELPFADVTKAHENYRYILAAYSWGYIFGSGDGNFYPDSEITPSEAIIITVRLMGYENPIRMRGGHITDYIRTANQLGITDGLDVFENSVLTYGEAALLITRALEAYPMEEESISDSMVIYDSNQKTLMEINFGITAAEGIVTENEFTNLYSPDSSLGDLEIKIGNTVYHSGKTNASEFLGIFAEIYYEEKTNTIVYIGEKAYENEITRLTSADKPEAESATSVVYTDGGKEKRVKLSDTVKFILNEKAQTYTPEILEADCGEYILADNNGDGKVDVIKATVYTVHTVSGVSASRGEIVSESGSVLSLDADASECTVRIYMNGTLSDITAIAPGSVILYAESAGVGKVLKQAVLCTESVVGKITQAGDNEIYIDDCAYPASAGFIGKATLGLTGTVVLNQYGEAVAFQRELRPVFGYLYGIKTEDFGTVYCRIFTEYDRWVTLLMKDKIKYNGASNSEALKVKSELEGTPQLIEYTVNSDGVIVSVNTALEGLEKFSDAEAAAIDDNVFRLSEEGSLKYNSNGKLLGEEIALGSDTIVFSVPAKGEKGSEDDYRIVSYSDFAADQNYNVKVYNADKTRIAGLCVVYAMPSVINRGNQMSSVLAVKSISEIIIDGDAYSAVSGYMNGQQITLPLRDEAVAEESGITGGLKEHDIIQVGFDSKGRISNISRVYSAEAGETQRFLTGSFTSRNSFIAGNVLSSDAGAGKCLIQYGTADRGILTLNSGLRAVYIYDSDARYPMTNGTVDDILEGDYVFATMSYSCAREVIVFR